MVSIQIAEQFVDRMSENFEVFPELVKTLQKLFIHEILQLMKKLFAAKVFHKTLCIYVQCAGIVVSVTFLEDDVIYLDEVFGLSSVNSCYEILVEWLEESSLDDLL